MTAVDAISIFSYLLALALAMGAALVAVRVARFRNEASAFIVSFGCLSIGLQVAAFVTPDWNPATMFVAYIPFACIGAWMGILGVRRVLAARSHP